jgi:hypothetical protein
MNTVDTIHDIVPQEVLVKIANRVARAARNNAKAFSSRIPRAIKVGTVSSTKQTASITIWLDTDIAPQAAAFEHGADPHVITARNAPLLVFMGTNDWAGQIIRKKSVNHPGIAPRPYLQPAKDDTREQNREELRAAVGRNMRLAIRGLARRT